MGIVHRITDKGDVRVQYEGYTTRWTIHPKALVRDTLYAPNDVVSVISDIVKVKEYQKGHGEWIEYMKSVSETSLFMISAVLHEELVYALLRIKSMLFNFILVSKYI